MDDDFKKAYSNLDVNNKRNELNNEMRFVFGIIKALRSALELDEGKSDIKNYDINVDNELTESQLLDFYYEDFYDIQKEVLDISDAIFNKDE